MQETGKEIFRTPDSPILYPINDATTDSKLALLTSI